MNNDIKWITIYHSIVFVCLSAVIALCIYISNNFNFLWMYALVLLTSTTYKRTLREETENE